MWDASRVNATIMIENGAAQPRKHDFRLLVLWPISIVIGAYVFVVASALPIAFTVGTSGIWLLFLWGVFGAIAGIIAGVLVGSAQRILLPVRVPWSKSWMRATFLGWTISGTVFWLLAGMGYLAFEEYPKKGLSMSMGIVLAAVVILVSCLIISIIQGFLIQRSIGTHDTHNWHSFWIWVRVTAIGWATGLVILGLLVYLHSVWGLLADLVTKMGGSNVEVDSYLLIPVSGTIAGVITAMAMEKLISKFPSGTGGSKTGRPARVS